MAATQYGLEIYFGDRSALARLDVLEEYERRNIAFIGFRVRHGILSSVAFCVFSCLTPKHQEPMFGAGLCQQHVIQRALCSYSHGAMFPQCGYPTIQGPWSRNRSANLAPSTSSTLNFAVKLLAVAWVIGNHSTFVPSLGFGLKQKEEEETLQLWTVTSIERASTSTHCTASANATSSKGKATCHPKPAPDMKAAGR